MTHPYTLIRTDRRTLAIQIDQTGTLIVRAPLDMTVSHIEDFLVKKRTWITKHQQKKQSISPKKDIQELSWIEIQNTKIQLSSYITPRVHKLWTGRGLPAYTSIHITTAETRWGSCSGQNGLCFSYRLAEQSREFIDAVITHELAHLRYKHHQRSFWQLVYEMMPEYEKVIARSRKNID